MTVGLTFDSGALIGLSRRDGRISKVFALARAQGWRVTVPAVVIAEWWRARSDLGAKILAAVRVEPVDEELAKRAGEACAATSATTTIDAIVMASAARRGDTVYTSDVGDLEALRAYFPGVRVLSVGGAT